MFDKLFGRRAAPPASPPSPPVEDPALWAARQAIAIARQTNPLAGARIGANEFNHWLVERMTGAGGVHVVSLLVALGAVGGFACQIAARHRIETAPDPRWQHAILEIGGADGRKYYFGDAINDVLIDDQYGLWRVAAGVMPQLGDRPVPDVIPIIKHVAATVGGPRFGVLRFPEGVAAGDTPSNYLRVLWPSFRQLMSMLEIGPQDWPTLLGIAAQQDLLAAKDVIDPAVGLDLFMQSAVAMAKVDPAEIIKRA